MEAEAETLKSRPRVLPAIEPPYDPQLLHTFKTADLTGYFTSESSPNKLFISQMILGTTTAVVPFGVRPPSRRQETCPTPCTTRLWSVSGITGGWSARKLTERACARWCWRRVVRFTDPTTTTVEHVPVGDAIPRSPLIGERTVDQPSEHVLCVRLVVGEVLRQHKDNPYSTDPTNPFRWIRSRRWVDVPSSWGRQSYRGVSGF